MCVCVCVCEIYEFFPPPLHFHSVHLLALRTDECSWSCGCACFRLQMAGASWSLCCGVISWFFICLNLAGNGELFQNAIHKWNGRCEAVGLFYCPIFFFRYQLGCHVQWESLGFVFHLVIIKHTTHVSDLLNRKNALTEQVKLVLTNSTANSQYFDGHLWKIYC